MTKELKVNVGDTVLYYHGSPWANKIPAITKVAKITPTGRIRVELYPSEQFNKYGNRLGGDSWNKPRIKVPSAEELQEVKEKTFIRRTVQKMNACKEDNISYKQAVDIMAILKGGEE